MKRQVVAGLASAPGFLHLSLPWIVWRSWTIKSTPIRVLFLGRPSSPQNFEIDFLTSSGPGGYVKNPDPLQRNLYAERLPRFWVCHQYRKREGYVAWAFVITINPAIADRLQRDFQQCRDARQPAGITAAHCDQPHTAAKASTPDPTVIDSVGKLFYTATSNSITATEGDHQDPTHRHDAHHQPGATFVTFEQEGK
jgi:hypothetical protein